MTASSPDGAAAIVAAVNRPSRAGRNLPAAIAVGVGMGAVILGSLLFERHLFVASDLLSAWVLRVQVRRHFDPTTAARDHCQNGEGGTAEQRQGTKCIRVHGMLLEIE